MRAVAYWTTTHSKRLGAQMPTRSPWLHARARADRARRRSIVLPELPVGRADSSDGERPAPRGRRTARRSGAGSRRWSRQAAASRSRRGLGGAMARLPHGLGREVRVLDDAEDVAEGVLDRRDLDPAADVALRARTAARPAPPARGAPRRRPRRPSTRRRRRPAPRRPCRGPGPARTRRPGSRRRRAPRSTARCRGPGRTRPSPPRGPAPCR